MLNTLNRLTKSLMMLFILLLFTGSSAFSQIPIELPDLTGSPGETETIAVNVGDLTDEEVLAFQFAILYDEEVINITGFDKSGTISEPFSIDENPEDGKYIFGGFGSSPLEGEGEFIYLEIEYLEFGETELTWDTEQTGFQGDTNPETEYTDGSVTVPMASLDVELPEAGYSLDEEIEIPVTVEDLTGEEVYSFQMDMSYDPDLLEITDVVSEGTLFEGNTLEMNLDQETGVVTIGGFSNAALEGDGTLFYLEATTKALGQSPLTFDAFEFNEGDPLANPIDGAITISDLEVSLPDVDGTVGETIQVPIYTDGPEDPIFSYQFTISYDESVIDIEGYTKEGTLSEDFSIENNPGDGEITIGGFSSQGFQEEGTLLYLDVNLLDVGESALEWSDFEYDEGAVFAGLTPGSVTVSEAYTEYESISDLLDNAEIGENAILTNEVIVTFVAPNFRNQHYLSDETGAVLVDDDDNVLSGLERGDGVTNFTFEFSEFSGTTQLVPLEDAEASSTDNDLPYWETTLADLEYVGEPRLVRVESVEFLDEGVFESSTNYDIIDPTVDDPVTFRTHLSDSDVIGEPIPLGVNHIMGIVDEYQDTPQIYATYYDQFEAVADIPEPPYEIGDVINYNGSFQFSNLGETNPAAWTVTSAEGSSVEVVDGAQDGDNRALRFDIAYDTQGDWYLNEAVNEPINVVEGEKYRVTAWLRADHDVDVIAGVYLGMPESGGWERARGWETPESEVGSEWMEIDFEHTATAENEEHGMRVGVEINHEDNDGGVLFIDNIEVTRVEATSAEDVTDAPQKFRLNQNYPNPFNPSTTISYEVPETAHVTIDVYNIVGQKMMSLVNSEQSQGVHTVNFDASDLSSGMYIYRMQAGDFVQTQKMMLVK